MSARTTITKKRMAPDLAVILRNVPKGYDWGWFARKDPRMHVQTLDSKHFNFHKVWLESKGKRVFEPAESVPSAVLKKLEAEVKSKRLHLEGRWSNAMIEKDWLELHMRGSVITLIAYPNVPGSRFTRTLDLADYLAGIYDPSFPITRKKPVEPSEVVLSREFPAIEIFPQRDESLRHHILLPPILWED